LGGSRTGAGTHRPPLIHFHINNIHRDTHIVVSTVRMTEVATDQTNQLALEAAM
jgi:hypothetical protein